MSSIRFALPNRQDLAAEASTGIDLAMDGGITFRILRAGGVNHAYGAHLAKALRALKTTYKEREAPPEVLKATMARVYADTVVIGWDGVLDAAQQPVPFSKEACFAMLNDPVFDYYYRAVDEYAPDAKNFRVKDAVGSSAQQIAEAAGN